MKFSIGQEFLGFLEFHFNVVKWFIELLPQEFTQKPQVGWFRIIPSLMPAPASFHG